MTLAKTCWNPQKSVKIDYYIILEVHSQESAQLFTETHLTSYISTDESTE